MAVMLRFTWTPTRHLLWAWSNVRIELRYLAQPRLNLLIQFAGSLPVVGAGAVFRWALRMRLRCLPTGLRWLTPQRRSWQMQWICRDIRRSGGHEQSTLRPIATCASDW